MKAAALGLTATALTFAVSSCGGAGPGPAFAPGWQHDGGRSIRDVYQRVGTTPLPEGKGVAVGITDSGLVGIGLDGTGRWEKRTALDARPTIAGTVVVATGGGQLFALDATTGRELWRVSSGGKRLRGAGDDGTRTAVSLGNAGGGGSRLLVVDRGGRIVLDKEPEPEIGVPGVVGDVVFVPWGNQYVSALDVTTGREIGRALLRTVTSRVRAIGGRLYFGQTALVAFDERIGEAAEGRGHHVRLPPLSLPGNPVWHRPGAFVTPQRANAHDKVNLFARPADPPGVPGIDSDRFIATYFRVVLGLNAQEGAVRWVHTLPRDALGAGAARGGFAVCEADGTVHFLGARSGGNAGSVSLGAPLTACVVEPGSFSIGAEKDPGPLREQIARALEHHANDMMSIQRVLLKELGADPDPEATRLLLDLASDARTPPELAADSRTLLSNRRSGAEHLLAALERRYDFLDDVLRPPPVGPIADALAAMNEHRAAPLLAGYLNEPTASTDDVRRAARALETLASHEELPDIRTFFTLYRATADDDHIVQAVLSAARILNRLGGDAERDLLEYSARDPLTQPQIKQGLLALAR
jgi:outer membrane protein assembly factor BamB